jgi:hypothetical protein
VGPEFSGLAALLRVLPIEGVLQSGVQDESVDPSLCHQHAGFAKMLVMVDRTRNKTDVRIGGEWSDPKKIIGLNAQRASYDMNFVLEHMENANLQGIDIALLHSSDLG